MTKPAAESAVAAMMPPAANTNKPTVMTGLRPKRSEAAPNAICSRPWVRP